MFLPPESSFGLLVVIGVALYCAISVMREVERRLGWCADCSVCQAKERRFQQEKDRCPVHNEPRVACASRHAGPGGGQ